MVLEGVGRTVTSLLTTLRVTAFKPTELSTAEWTALASLTLPVQTTWRAAHL